ncbi:AT-hook motif nuclear-localized protein 6 [Hordeum vulgare]|nr:AT-hook motif nuclear-localized protein 6 [Hordeum vulgare]
MEGGAISADAGKATYGAAEMHKSPLLHPQPQPIVGARMADADEEPRATEIVPQIITVKGGEDVAMEVMSYGGNGWAVFIMSADGTVCNVTLHQPASPHETVIHEGFFDIVSLSGSYLPSKANGMSSGKGVFAISLVGADGRIFGGGLAGPLIAASPVQVVIGRFATDEEEESKQDVASGTPGATEPSDSSNGSSSDPGSPSN